MLSFKNWVRILLISFFFLKLLLIKEKQKEILSILINYLNIFKNKEFEKMNLMDLMLKLIFFIVLYLLTLKI